MSEYQIDADHRPVEPAEILSRSIEVPSAGQNEARAVKVKAAISDLHDALQPDANVDSAPTPDTRAAIARMERKLEEQEQTLRHVLTMLIEWIEDDPSREAA